LVARSQDKTGFEHPARETLKKSLDGTPEAGRNKGNNAGVPSSWKIA